MRSVAAEIDRLVVKQTNKEREREAKYFGYWLSPITLYRIYWKLLGIYWNLDISWCFGPVKTGELDDGSRWDF